MESIIVKFEVAMDNEQKKLKNVEQVEFTVDFPEDCMTQLVADAIAHQKVKWQAQIRGNWDKFIEDGVPKRITYGNPLYGRKQGVRAPTEQEMLDAAAKRFASMTPEQIQEFARTGKFPEGV